MITMKQYTVNRMTLKTGDGRALIYAAPDLNPKIDHNHTSKTNYLTAEIIASSSPSLILYPTYIIHKYNKGLVHASMEYRICLSLCASSTHCPFGKLAANEFLYFIFSLFFSW